MYFQDVIFETFEEELQGKFTPEVRKAWEKILTYMLHKIQEGYSMEIKSQQSLSPAPQLCERLYQNDKE